MASKGSPIAKNKFKKYGRNYNILLREIKI